MEIVFFPLVKRVKQRRDNMTGLEHVTCTEDSCCFIVRYILLFFTSPNQSFGHSMCLIRSAIKMRNWLKESNSLLSHSRRHQSAPFLVISLRYVNAVQWFFTSLYLPPRSYFLLYLFYLIPGTREIKQIVRTCMVYLINIK